MKQAENINHTETVCNQVVALTEEFIGNKARHNPDGLRQLISRRRKLLALLDDKAPANLSGKKSAELLQKIRSQEAALAVIGIDIKCDLEKTLNSLKRSTSVFKKMRLTKSSPSRFIDRKS